MALGFPYMCSYDPSEGQPFDSFTNSKYSKYFIAGFTAAVVTSPSFAFAEEIKKAAKKGAEVGPVVARDAKANAGAAKLVQTTVNVAGCGAAIGVCKKAAEEAMQQAAVKHASTSSASAVTIVSCVFLAGFCLGKITTKSIDKYFGQ